MAPGIHVATADVTTAAITQSATIPVARIRIRDIVVPTFCLLSTPLDAGRDREVSGANSHLKRSNQLNRFHACADSLADPRPCSPPESSAANLCGGETTNLLTRSVKAWPAHDNPHSTCGRGTVG
jgi:hypothetical protein